ncbi:MAG: hypothetical protein ACLP9Y_09765 [Mycobacterium sp.]
MPKRSTLFQEVVAVIYEHLAEGAEKEESAMLTNSVTGEKREVDVVLRIRTAGVELVIGVEATGLSDARRQASLQPEASLQPDPVDVGWVEEMIGKHANLPTDKVILVSETGFTPQARDLALKTRKMVPVSPETLGDGDPAFRIVNAVRSLWPKRVDLSPESARVFIDVPGEGIKWFQASPDLDVFARDGRGPELLLPVIHALIRSNFLRIAKDIDLANIAEDFDGAALITVGPGWTVEFDGEEQSLYARYQEGEKTEFHRIDGMEITAKIVIRVRGVIPLHHRRLAEIDVNYAFGEGSFGDTPALIVATEGEGGSKVSIRLNPKHKKKSQRKKKSSS